MQTGNLNIRQDDAVKPERGRIQHFVDLMKDLFPDGLVRKWVTYWLAYLIQHPDKVLRGGIVLHGKGLQGQTIFTHVLLPKIFGPSNVAKIDGGDLKGQWNKGIKGKQIVVVANSAESDAHEIQNLANLIFLSNHGPAVDFAKDDRRYAVSRVADRLSPEDVEQIRAWIEDGGAARVRFYLENVKLDCFNPYGDPPRTDDKL